MKKLITLFLFVILVVVLVGCQSTEAVKASYIALEINPSIEMVVGEDGTVEYANALNEDGDTLLAEMDLTGEDLDTALGDIIDEATDLGFIDPEATETDVQVTTVAEDESESESVNEKVRNKINTAFANRGMFGLAKKKQMTADIIAEAESLGIGAGQLRLIKQVQELNPDLTTEAALELSTKDLMDLLKNKGSEIKDLIKTQRDEFFAARDAIIAEYAPQIDPLQTQIDELTASLETAAEDQKADIQAQIDTLQAQLDPIIAALEAEIKTLRDEYKAAAVELRAQLKVERQTRIQEHKEKVAQFREEFKNNKKEMKENVENWHKGKNNNNSNGNNGGNGNKK